MSDFQQELAAMTEQAEQEPEVKLPSLEEQKAIVAELKKLEEQGQLTPEVLEQYFAQFSATAAAPVH